MRPRSGITSPALWGSRIVQGAAQTQVAEVVPEPGIGAVREHVKYERLARDEPWTRTRRPVDAQSPSAPGDLDDLAALDAIEQLKRAPL
ncbi:MAG: hypothetical protein H0T59_10990 [Chloroflexi bacterium]|nr:hypothetical protein [Chloroflexota bacterium]